MKILYFDCFSGISGDMTAGALLDLGIPINYLKSELNKLNLKGYHIEAKKVNKKGIIATKFNVIIDKKAKVHERNYNDILTVIEKNRLSKQVKDLAIRILNNIAKAESKIHNKALSQLTFHEIGAIDTIVDIISTSICLNKLGIDKIYSSSVPLGNGFIKFSHGKWPNPGPATIEILKNSNAKIRPIDIDKELVTPTGAAILSLAEFQTPEFTLEKIGYGAGNHEFEHPNVLRVFLGEEVKRNPKEEITNMIETNIDDMNPQIYQYLMEKLFANGVLDVFLTNIMIKKQRPGIKLSVICKIDDTDKLAEIIFKETTTLGMRIYPTARKRLDIEKRKVKTKYGEITLKIGKLNGKVLNISPEYEDCVKIAEKHNIPLKKVINDAKIYASKI